MSHLAIAAVTATLRQILQSQTDAVTVTTLPPDKANAVANAANRLNLFLYHIAPNAAWRNQTIPTKVRPGESGYPPVALNLYYLLTAYGDDQADEADHRLLGRGIQILNDQAVLSSDAIKNATSEAPLKDAQLQSQFEQVRITPETLSLDEMSRLWQTFQTQYRVSAAYQASVVLIESKRETKSAPPVLKRGEQGEGVNIVASMPGVLEGIEYRDLRTREPTLPAAQLGDVITLSGRQLPGRRCKVLFIDSRKLPTATQPEANVVGRMDPEPDSNDARIYVRLNPQVTSWTSGPLHVLLQDLPVPNAASASPARLKRSNALRFDLAPSLLLANAMPAIVTVENGRRQLVLNCHPEITKNSDGTWPDISLLLSPRIGSASVAPIPLNSRSQSISTTTPVFEVETVPPGDYRVRLRIETVESLVMRRNGNTFEFDERQVVTL